MYIRTEKYIFWIISIVFTIGMLYSSVIDIPTIKKDVTNLATRQTIIETNYDHIVSALDRIEKKITVTEEINVRYNN